MVNTNALGGRLNSAADTVELRHRGALLLTTAVKSNSWRQPGHLTPIRQFTVATFTHGEEKGRGLVGVP